MITCQASRAIYLDLATDYSGEACIALLRRFMNRRGIPEMIYSDNGTSFTAENVQDFAMNCAITWKFSLEKAPWFNGFTERLIKSVKSCLKKTLNNKKISYDEFLTLLSEIERTINNRPLTYVYDDITEEPLTPNHMLHGKRIGKNNGTTENVIQLAQTTEKLIEHFWERWKHEYLIELRESYNTNKNRRFNECIKENDIVLISEDNVKRNQWRQGRVSTLLRGKDGKVRGAEVVVVNKNGNGVLRRPISKLFPFEFQRDENVKDIHENDANEIVFVNDKDTIPVVGV